MDAVINAHGLQVAYGKHVALNLRRLSHSAGVDWSFWSKCAGKTTLLRTLVGDIAKFKGSLQAPSRTDISYLPDEPFLYPWLSVGQCVELFTARHSDFRVDVFEEFLAGAAFSASSKVRSLSKGMSERLHLALIMSRAPKLYVLDEPLAGVDPLARDYLLELIHTLRSPEALYY